MAWNRLTPALLNSNDTGPNRASTSSAATIIGLRLGPYVVGMLSDATGDLRKAMLSINVVAIPITLLMLLIACRAERDEAALLERAV
jgi:cyanate permease